MAPKLAMLEGCLVLLASMALSANAAKVFADSSTGASMVSRVSARFHAELDRMLMERQQSEAVLNRTLSVERAYHILQKARKANASALVLIEEGLRTSKDRHAHRPTSRDHHAHRRTSKDHHAHRLRAHPAKKSLVEEKYTPTASLQKANGVLGQMITEANMEYDQLHLECSQYFHKQCSLMETCREDISSANSLAASWRSKVLAAQSEINICEVRLPRLKDDLATTLQECATRLGHLRRDLQVVMNDVAVMEEVLNLTQCTGKFFLQMQDPKLMKCPHPCKKNASFAALGHEDLHKKLTSLKSQHVRKLVQEGLMELTEQEGEQDGEAELGEQGASPTASVALSPNASITVFKNPPLPQAQLPSDPCQGISYDSGEGPKGCTLRKTPACFNLQNKFLTIQGETIDKRDELLEEISNLEASCKEAKDTLETEITTFTTKQASEHTKLADATSGENEAAEEGQTKSAQHTELKTAMLAERTSCSAKFRSLESELCALKKIRGELNKMKGDTHPFFQDCEVAEKWEEKECTVTCGGGVQELTRAIITGPSGGGAQCPPTKQMQSCNQQPCPVDCKMSQWSGFSACSAECGGGVAERTRTIHVQARYGGDPCEDVTETVPCNMQSCDEDCKLEPWSKWSECSKACDGGSRFRRRIVQSPALGRGKCPAVDSPERLHRKSCNEQACVRDATLPLLCSSKVDLVLLLDGSGSLGESGWAATKAFAKKFVMAFDGPSTDALVSIILYSGPYSYTYMRKCAAGGSSLNMETDCQIKMVQHFSSDIAATQANLDALSWPRGTTLTSQALELANSELTLGRAEAQKVVLTITDGIPMSARSTGMAAERLRKTARLMFGAVGLSTRGLRYMTEWGTEPSKENVLNIKSFGDLESMDTVDTLVADMCSNVTVPTAR